MRVEEIRGVCVCGGKKQRGKTKKKKCIWMKPNKIMGKIK